MSSVAPDASAFDLPASPQAAAHANGSPAAVLCLHGLTGTPYEVRPIAEALAARGYRVRGPVLPGHDSSPDDLAQIPYRAWLDAARAEYQTLRSEHERVFVAGLSLGGLLTLALAADHDLAGAAVVGTPLRFSWPIPHAVALGRFVYRMLPKRSGSDIADHEARARHPGFDRMPLASVHELIRFQRVVEAKLSRIEVPLLVAHGRRDRTANPEDLEAIVRGARSREVETLYLERSAHVVPVDHDGPQLCEAIADFFSRPR